MNQIFISEVRDSSAACLTCGHRNNQTTESNPSLDLIQLLFSQLQIKTLVQDHWKEFVRRMIQCAQEFYRTTDLTKYIDQNIKIIGDPNPIVEMIRTIQQYL